MANAYYDFYAHSSDGSMRTPRQARRELEELWGERVWSPCQLSVTTETWNMMRRRHRSLGHKTPIPACTPCQNWRRAVRAELTESCPEDL